MKFSDDQINQLKEVFATKDYFKNELRKSLAPIKRDIKSMKKDLNWVMGRYDTRLVHLEKHALHPPGRADN
jgi:hypothetical protein